jgi:hypothetical protein
MIDYSSYYRPPSPRGCSPDLTASTSWDGPVSSERVSSTGIRRPRISTRSLEPYTTGIFDPSSSPAGFNHEYVRQLSARRLSTGQDNPTKTLGTRTSRDRGLLGSSAHILKHFRTDLLSTRDWKSVQSELPEAW